MKISAAMQMSSAKGAQRLEGAPANETDAKAQLDTPVITLTDAQKKKLVAQAKALPATSLEKLPAYLAARLVWMAMIQAKAWRDREAISQVHDEAQPISAHDIEEFGRRVEFAREVEADRGLSVVRDVADVTKMSDASIWSEMLAHRGTLCSALTLRFAKDAGLRDTVVAIRGTSRQLDVTRGLRQLLRVFEDAALAEWVTKLPKGEGPALARLRLLHAEWTRRRAQGATPVLTVADDDLMRRAWALAVEPLERVLRVGRYLTRGVEGRDGDYGHFRAPRATRSKSADATKKTPVADPVSKPTG